jgi:tRNA A37 threonylcarbamoyladenosine synthetase subunit TsaC/SUA5/YrdC
LRQPATVQGINQTRKVKRALTRDFKETVAARVQSDSAFARALLDEAITLFVNGEPQSGNPTMSNISSVFAAIKRTLKVEVHAQVVAV